LALAACALLALATTVQTLRLERAHGRVHTIHVATEAVGGSGATLVSTVTPIAGYGRLSHAVIQIGSTSRAAGYVLAIQALPAAPAGHSWQAWSIDARGVKRSLAVLTPARAGALAVVRLPRVARGASITVAITLEPLGGSLQPTTAPLAAGTMSA
jgi:anti-sigma-K factor RskA